jgi:hypothetical protein
MKVKIIRHEMGCLEAGYRIGETYDVSPGTAEQLIRRGDAELATEEASIDAAPENKMEKRGPGRPRKAVA